MMQKKVLIVDDALFMRVHLKKIILGVEGFSAYEAEDGEQALELYPKIQPDLVFLDISMPGINGIDVLKEMIKMDPAAQVVMCSAIGQQSMVLSAMDSGAKQFIVKPFSPEHIREILHRYQNGPEREEEA